MSQNLTRFPNGIQVQPSTATLSNDGEIKYDSSVSGYIIQQSGATGQLVISSTTGTSPTLSGLIINGNESVTGTLGVSGAVTVNNNLTATGALAVSGAATINGVVTVNNNESITGTLGVSGAVTVNNTLAVTGAASAGSLASSAEVLLKEIATPSNPASGFLKIYPKSDNKLYSLNSVGTETAIGSGVAAAFNLLTMDTSFSMTRTNNQDAESTVGDWAAYANGAAVAPTSMSGGSPTSTIARTTSTPLDGAGSFLYSTASGATYEGEGVSCTANVPPGYRGLNVCFSFVYATTGTIVEDDFRLYAYAINGASSGVITPFSSGKILGSSGKASCVFSVPTDCTQIRVGIHNARSSTGAVTIKFDDVYVTNVIVPVGLAGSGWIPYTPVFVNLGTPTSVNFFYRRVGQNVQIIGTAVGGTAVAAICSISLPPNVVPDPTLVNGPSIVGRLWKGVVYNSSLNLFLSSGTATVFNITGSAGSTNFNEYSTLNGNSSWNSGEQANFWAEFPVAGWSSNVQMANSATFNISSYLASGTQVTGASPTKLGQYRSMIGNASSNVLTDSTPTVFPNISDGILYYPKNYASAGTAGNISRWEIFVGKNKQVKFQFYSSAGRTGWLLTDLNDNMASIERGTSYGYDPTTGVAFIDGSTSMAGLATRSLGLIIGPANTTITDATTNAYFDIVVSENALAVGVEAPLAPTVQTFTSGSGTYTLPTSRKPLYLKVKMVGGGGGGAGSGTNGQLTQGGNGGNTTFGTSLLTANGGTGGTLAGNSSYAAGGTATVNSPAIKIVAISGADGGGGSGVSGTSGVYIPGACGASSPFGGAGPGGGGTSGQAGDSAVANSGSGGGGGSINGQLNTYSGMGGAAGGYIEAFISSPSASYSYAVGSGGSAGTGGSNGAAGGAGGSGIIIVEEYYQ